jgi:hypothetical protein
MSKGFSALACVAILSAALLFAHRAYAQERDPAAAQALFDQARTLMNAKSYGPACEKLAESLRLDPGIGTQFNLAVCQEFDGKLATAWASFLEVASLANASGQPDRAKTATRRASLLESRLPRLQINVPPESRATGLEVTRDGAMVGEPQWGLPLPLDPGEHRVEVTAPGKLAFAGTVSVAEGATTSFNVPVLEASPTSAAVPVPPVVDSAQPVTPKAASQAPLHPPVDDRRSAPSSQSSAGPSGLVIGLGVVGLVAVGAGTVFGLMAGSKNDDSKVNGACDASNVCTKKGADLRDDAFLFADLSTVGFVVGGAAILTAGVLWLTGDEAEPSDSAALTWNAGPAGASMAYGGTF